MLAFDTFLTQIARPSFDTLHSLTDVNRKHAANRKRSRLREDPVDLRVLRCRNAS